MRRVWPTRWLRGWTPCARGAEAPRVQAGRRARCRRGGAAGAQDSTGLPTGALLGQHCVRIRHPPSQHAVHMDQRSCAHGLQTRPWASTPCAWNTPWNIHPQHASPCSRPRSPSETSVCTGDVSPDIAVSISMSLSTRISHGLFLGNQGLGKAVCRDGGSGLLFASRSPSTAGPFAESLSPEAFLCAMIVGRNVSLCARRSDSLCKPLQLGVLSAGPHASIMGTAGYGGHTSPWPPFHPCALSPTFSCTQCHLTNSAAQLLASITARPPRVHN